MTKQPSTITIDGEVYDIIPSEFNAASKALTDMYLKLGSPDDPLSTQGEKIMKIIIAVWEDLQPEQAKQWYAERMEYKNNEMTIREQVHKKTGRSLASYPSLVYKLMKAIFPKYSLSNRENNIKLVQKYPIFQMANKI